jgi:hypothetical protein
MPTPLTNTRVTRLEDLTRVLVDSQIRTDARLVQLREESNEREKRMDERIGKLVVRLGEFIRQNGKTGA